MIKKISYIPILYFTAIFVAGCSFDNPTETLRATMFESTKLTERKIVVEKNHFVEKIDAGDLDYDYLKRFVKEYEYNGGSPVYALFTYDPDVNNDKLMAFNKSNIAKGQLAKLGINDLVVKTMPVQSAYSRKVIIGYDKFVAKGPSGCDDYMLGSDASYNQDTDYVAGCTIKNMKALQTAYPADLLGQNRMSDYNAKRAGTVVQRDPYSGDISDSVPSYIVSEVGSGS